MANDLAEVNAEGDVPDVNALAAARDTAAEAIGTFEAEYAENEACWKQRRIDVNQAYQAADAAWQAENDKAAREIAEAARVKQAEAMVETQRLLDDPNSSAAVKDLARQLLDAFGGGPSVQSIAPDGVSGSVPVGVGEVGGE